MKPGDLVVWTKHAAVYSPAPAAGDFAGTVVRVDRRKRGRTRDLDKIEILAEKTFIVGRRFIEVISES